MYIDHHTHCTVCLNSCLELAHCVCVFVIREALLAEMGVSIREDGGTVGVFSPKKVSFYPRSSKPQTVFEHNNVSHYSRLICSSLRGANTFHQEVCILSSCLFSQSSSV